MRSPSASRRWLGGVRQAGRGTLLGGGAALAFLVLGSRGLAVQGLHYDEVFQAPAAFAWVGERPPFFAYLPVAGIPVFTMPYAGALKSAIFGVYLAAGGTFSVEAWRMLAIALAALAVGIVVRAVARRFGALAATLVAGLWITDLTFLLQSARDWGPVALGTLLRAGMIAGFLGSARGRPRGAFGAGVLAGLAVFEKLHHAALLPVLLVAAGARRDGRGRRLAAVALGVALGAAPVVWANAKSLRESGRLFSFAAGQFDPAGGAHLDLAPRALGLGAAAGTRRVLFGGAGPPSRAEVGLEAAALLAALALATIGGGRAARRWVFAWGVTVAAVLLLPAPVDDHHLSVATPLQYVAIGIGLGRPGIRRRRRAPPTAGAGRRAMVAAGIALWGVLRGVGLAGAIVQIENRWAPLWDPQITRAAAWLAPRAGRETVFLGEWGTGTQIVAMSQGRAVVFPVFAAFGGPESLDEWLARVTTDRLVVVGLEPGLHRGPRVTDALLDALRRRPDWREVRREVLRREVPPDSPEVPPFSTPVPDLRPVLLWSFERAS